MVVRLALFVIVLSCGFATSCSSDAGTATTSPVTMSTGLFGGAHSAACDTDLDLIETVVESYLALNGGSEVTEDQLVQQGLLREQSVLHDIGPGATVIPSPTGGCVS